VGAPPSECVSVRLPPTAPTNGARRCGTQGNGRSNAYAVTAIGSQVFVAGHAYGNLTFTSNHATNGASGEINDHTSVGVAHATNSFAGGRYTDAASSQNSMDGIIYKISSAGVPQAVYAMDTTPSDGVYNSSSENGNSLGYNYMYAIDAFPDNQHVVGIGSFRGRLACPMGSAGESVLMNRKSGNYDGWAVKVDGTTMQGVWAVAPAQTAVGRNYFRNTKVTAAGHVIITGDKRPSRTYQGRLLKLNGADGSVVWLNDNYVGAYYFYGLEVIGEEAFVGGVVRGSNVDPFSTGAITSSSGAGFVSKVNSAGVHTWSKTMGSRVRSVAASPDGAHIYAYGENAAAWTDGSCSVSGALGGLLVKLSATTGSCVWAKDIGQMLKVVADASFVYGIGYDDEPVAFGMGLTLESRGPEYDGWLLKWSASDGVGQWGMSIGGTGDDFTYDIALSASGGILLAGRTTSDAVDLAGVTIK
jgi:hypothetical protein